MNPWEIVSWVGAVCVAVMIVAVTVAGVVGVARGGSRRSKPSVSVMRGERKS